MKRKRVKKGARSKRVREERRDFYVYYLRRPDKWDLLDEELWGVFYVGRGCNGRMFVHRKEALAYREDPTIIVVNPIKTRIIIKLWEQGLDFVEEIMFDNLTTEEADEIEMSAIVAYGRISLGTGCLANMDDGGKGSPGPRSEEFRIARKLLWQDPVYIAKQVEAHTGLTHSDEAKDKIRKAKTGVPLSETHKQHVNENRNPPCGEDHWLYNGHHSEESIQKMRGPRPSIAKENHPLWKVGHTEATKKKQSEIKKGKYLGKDNSNYGNYWSDSKKSDMSATKIRRHAGTVYIRDIVERMIQIGDDYGEE